MRRFLSRDQKNSFWAIVEYAWYPCLLFLSTRYFIEYLGIQNYGMWMFLTALVASSAILNVGMSGAIVKVISEELGRGASSRVIGSVANTALGIALVAGLLTALIIVALVLAGSRQGPLIHDYLIVTVVVATVLVLLEYVDIAFSSVLKGGEHFRETARIEVLFKTVQLVAALLAAVIWTDLLPVYAVLVMVSIARVAAKTLRMKTVYDIHRIRPAFEALSQLMLYAKWGWLHGIGGFMLMTVDRLVVGYKLGPEALAYYSLLMMIPQQIHALAAAAVSVIFPRISRLHSSNQGGEIAALTAKVSRITALGAAVAVLPLVIFPNEIFRLWLGKALPDDAMIALVPLTLSFLFLCLNITPYYMLMGLGQVKYVAIINLVAGVASVAVLITFIGEGGLYIAAVSKCVYATVLLLQFHRVNRSMNHFTRSELR